MGIRKTISEKKSHYLKLGIDGLKFLKEIKKKKNGELITIKIKNYLHPISLRNKTSDIPTFYQCIFNKEYDINVDFTPKVIVDLGANIGLTTVFFKNRYPNCKIICVEPEESNFNLLKENTKNYKNIKLYKAGVWNKSTNLIIEDKGYGHYGYTVKESNKKTENSILSIGVNEIIKENNLEQIDILKIDIEGAEKELFEENYSSWLPKVKVIIIEFHDRMKPNCAKTFFKALINYNFEFSLKGENVICYIKND